MPSNPSSHPNRYCGLHPLAHSGELKRLVARTPREKLIPVLPKNYRRIAHYAIESTASPVVLVNRKRVENFTEAGPLTQRGIGACRDFEVLDGTSPILGFHNSPREMWFSASHASIAEHRATQDWFTIQGGAS